MSANNLQGSREPIYTAPIARGRSIQINGNVTAQNNRSISFTHIINYFNDPPPNPVDEIEGQFSTRVRFAILAAGICFVVVVVVVPIVCIRHPGSQGTGPPSLYVCLATYIFLLSISSLLTDLKESIGISFIVIRY